jgi:Fe-S cluster assembly protein SufD
LDINLVFINGSYSRELSNVNNIPDGIKITTVEEAVAAKEPVIEQCMTKYCIGNEAPFVALNEALNLDGAYIHVKDKTVHPGLIHIVHVTDGASTNIITSPRTIITLGVLSEITVLESHVGFNDQMTYFSNALTDIFLAEGATLHYAKAQKDNLKAYHVDRTRTWQERNTTFDCFSLVTGAKLSRNDLDIILNGEGANATLNALYSVYDDQHVDNHTSVDHRLPNCTSTQLYKGILNHAARAVFNGKIFVREIAQQTNSYQLNKNLLLGPDCRVDTKPQLEIHADDVKCTHGATIGQLDEDELFYLQTRCIPRDTATKMLVHGFADDVFERIKNERVQKICRDLIQPSLEVL